MNFTEELERAEQGFRASVGAPEVTTAIPSRNRGTAEARNRPRPGLEHCIFAECAATCARRYACRRDDRVVRVMTPGECNTDCPRCVARLRISAVITAWNEGDEVRKTVESLAASVLDPTTDLEIIVVDDGSTDGSCDFAVDLASAGARSADIIRARRNAAGSAVEPVPVVGLSVDVLRDLRVSVVKVRHDKPLGVGRSRNAGWRAATGDVITFHDGHMRFPPGGLELLARKALTSGAFVCAASAGLKVEGGVDKPAGNRLWGCELYWNRRDGLQPKWMRLARPPEEEWMRSACPMGAGYVFSRALAERMEAATGQFWEDTAGRWGFSEQAMAVKAFLMDVPVLFSRDVWIQHLYRGTNPTPGAGREYWLNVTRSMFVLLGPEHFDRRFRPWCEAVLGKGEVSTIVADAPNAADICRDCGRPPEDVFTDLLGSKPPLTEYHLEHDWLAEIAGACHSLRPVHRILQWRPGESTLCVRDMLPDAEIHAIEMPGHRAENWRELAPAHNVKLHVVDLGPAYAGIAEKLAGKDGFDLVLVGGEMQDQCRVVAEKVLQKGGRILVNPAADRMQIANEFRKKERKLLEQFAKGRAEPAAGAEATKPLLTVLLLNWRRPENIGPILDCLAAQTVPLQVFLWNNGGPLCMTNDARTENVPIAEHRLVKLSVESSENMRCWPRWLLASMADTEFVCSMDDDLAFADARVLEDAIAACRDKCPDGVVGFFGWERLEGKGYKDSRHVNGADRDTRVDFVKGRFMLFRRELLGRVPLAHPAVPDPADLLKRADDFYVNLCISRGRRRAHLVPGLLKRRWKNLPTRGVAMYSEPGHYAERDKLIRAMFAHYQAKGEGL